MNYFLANPVFRAICKVIYKYSHSSILRHNRNFWSFYKINRDESGVLNKVYFLNTLVADNTILEKPINKTAMLVATGPSVKDLDPECFNQKDIDYIGVNGAVSLGIHFKYYILIDKNFITNRFDIVSQVLLNENCTLFTTPVCLNIMLNKMNFKKYKCQIKVIETVTEDKVKGLFQEATFADTTLNHYYFKNHYGFSTNIFHSIYDYFTVAYVALQIIYALGYKTINIAGLDMNNFEKPRFYEDGQNKQPTMLDHYSEIIFDAFDVAAEFFDKHNVEVFNLSKNSAIESFKKVDANDVILKRNEKSN